MIEFTCSSCCKPMTILPEHAGRRVGCPHCNAPVDVPGLPVAPAPKPRKTEALNFDVNEDVDDRAAVRRTRRRSAPSSVLFVIGLLLMILGSLFLAGALLLSDISVSTSLGSVVNLAKMTDKIVSVILGATAFLTGAVFFAAGCVIGAVQSHR